jgi:replicative DNA helicase
MYLCRTKKVLMNREEIIRKIEGAAGTDDATGQEIWRRVKLLCEDELRQLASDTPPKSVSRLVSDALTQVDGRDTDGLMPSGFDSLDKLTGGFAEGEFVVVGARPAMGKTQFLVCLSLNLSRNCPVMFLTYDLPETLLSYRILASLSGIEACRISRRQCTPQEQERLNHTADQPYDYQLSVAGTPHRSVDMLIPYCIRQIREHGIKVIVLDCLQMLDYSRYRRYNRDAEMDEICRKLRELAKEHQVCIIASSQLNRSVENRSVMEGKRPQLSDLRESGSIEQYADKVLFLHRPEYYGIVEDECGENLTGRMEVMVAKNTRGATGDVRLKINAGFTGFTEEDRDGEDMLSLDTFRYRLAELGLEAPFDKLTDTFDLKPKLPF